MNQHIAILFSCLAYFLSFGHASAELQEGNHTTQKQGTLPHFTRGQGIQELDAKSYRELAKHGVVFINFTQPLCDLAEYYNDMIRDLNEKLPDIPIYSFNKELYPEIGNEFDLYGVETIGLAKIVNGNFEQGYEGYRGDNLIAEWVIAEWNKDKGTNITSPNYRRKRSTSSGSASGNADYEKVHYTFSKEFDPALPEGQQFRIDPEMAKLASGTLSANGTYFSRRYTRSASIVDFNNFTVYCEFAPNLTQYNTVLMEGSRNFGIVIQKGKLTFLFNNGDFGYVAEETKISPLKWHKLAVSFNKDTRTLQVILDGKRLDDFIVSKDITISNYRASLGITDFGNGRVYSGFLDDLILCNTTLTGDNLRSFYDQSNTGTTNISTHQGGDILGNYVFSDLSNEANPDKDFILESHEAFLTNGHLKLTGHENGQTSIEAKNLSGLNPENTTIMLDFFQESTTDRYRQVQLFALKKDYWNHYVSVELDEGDISIDIHYYARKWGDKPLTFKTSNLNLVEKNWYNLIVTFNEPSKQLLVMLDGKMVMNETFNTTLKAYRSTDQGSLVFENYKGFSGFVDNLQITRSAFNSYDMIKLYKSRKEHGAIGVVTPPPPISNEAHASQIKNNLHEWWYDDYKNFSLESFSELPIIQEKIDLNNFDQPLLNACIFFQTNKQRKKHGRKVFEHSSKLEKAATMHSNDMAELHFFDHVNHRDRSKRTPEMRMKSFGVNAYMTSENIASRYEQNISYWYLAELLVKQWMESPPHRETLLSPELSHLGCGVMFSQTYDDMLGGNFSATQNFFGN